MTAGPAEAVAVVEPLIPLPAARSRRLDERIAAGLQARTDAIIALDFGTNPGGAR